MTAMRIQGSVTTLSWIPSEAVSGLATLPFDSGVAHYDAPPPPEIGAAGADIESLRQKDRFRFANHLSAWIEVQDDATIVGAGYSGGGIVGSTTIMMGKGITVAAVALADRQAEPVIGDGWVRFHQTAGGRTGVPAPRTVRRPPYVQFQAPIAWSTLELTVHVDGRVHGELLGASPFPRHWVYDHAGRLVAKSGLIDFRHWYKDAFGDHTPWGDLESPALVTAIETALERELSALIMRGQHRPRIQRISKGECLVQEGDAGDEVFLVLDGVVAIEVGGRRLTDLGPGTVLGERALLEGGRRTATVRAVTACKLAVASAATIEAAALAQLATQHRLEDSQ
jgi:hypothetical protein